MYSSKLALRNLGYLNGKDLPKDVAAAVEKNSAGSKKARALIFPLEQAKVRKQTNERRALIQKMGKNNTAVTTKKTIQVLRNETTSYLKELFGMLFNFSCVKRFVRLSFSRSYNGQNREFPLVRLGPACNSSRAHSYALAS